MCTRAHTHTLTHTPARPPERRRAGASTQTLLALGRSRVERTESGEQDSDAALRSPEKWVSGRPPGREKKRDLEKKKKKKKKKGQDSSPGNESLETRTARRGSTRRELGFLPLGQGTAVQGEEEASAVTRALPCRHRPPALASPHPHYPKLIKLCRLPRRPRAGLPAPARTSGSERPWGPSPRPSPPLTSAGGATHPTPSAAPTAAEINNLACESRRSRSERFFFSKKRK